MKSNAFLFLLFVLLSNNRILGQVVPNQALDSQQTRKVEIYARNFICRGTADVNIRKTIDECTKKVGQEDSKFINIFVNDTLKACDENRYDPEFFPTPTSLSEEKSCIIRTWVPPSCTTKLSQGVYSFFSCLIGQQKFATLIFNKMSSTIPTAPITETKTSQFVIATKKSTVLPSSSVPTSVKTPTLSPITSTVPKPSSLTTRRVRFTTTEDMDSTTKERTTLLEDDDEMPSVMPFYKVEAEDPAENTVSETESTLNKKFLSSTTESVTIETTYINRKINTPVNPSENNNNGLVINSTYSTLDANTGFKRDSSTESNKNVPKNETTTENIRTTWSLNVDANKSSIMPAESYSTKNITYKPKPAEPGPTEGPEQYFLLLIYKRSNGSKFYLK